jgi:hypothetical protein
MDGSVRASVGCVIWGWDSVVAVEVGCTGGGSRGYALGTPTTQYWQ